MNTTQWIVRVAMVIGLTVGIARAGDPPPSDSKAAEKPAAAPADEAKKSDKGQAAPGKNRNEGGPARNPGLAVRRILLAFDRLQQQMYSELNLTDAQKTKVGTVFDNYRKDVQDPTVKPELYRGPDDPTPPRPAAETKGKIQPKHGKGAAPEVSRSRSTALDAAPRIIEDLNDELDVDQRKKFEPMARRWKVLQPTAGLRDGPMARLMRCLKDPALDIKEEQRQELMEKLGKKMNEYRSARMAQADLGPVAAEMRSEIVKELTPRQQEHFNNTFKALEADAAAEAADEAKRAEEAKKKQEKAPETTDK